MKIEAKSAISVLVSEANRDRIIFRKSSDEKLPIASITKLITSLVVLENYDPSLPITVSEIFPVQNNDPGHLIAGEVYAAKSILYPLLIESSNEAAYSVAEVIGATNFVELMNLEAKKIGMNNSYFINSSGIDPVNPENGINYSTAEDLVALVKYISKKPEIMEIISLKEYDLISADGIIHHKLSTTNELLEKSDRVIGGKTGQTPTARGCLLLLLRTPGQNPDTKNKEYLINIILGSEDRFGEMEKLIDWEGKAYQW